MGKLIIGIAAVICLDLGFVAFMASDRQQETAMLVVNSAEDYDLTGGLAVEPASLSVYDEPVAVPAPAIETAPPRVVYVPVYVERKGETALQARSVKKSVPMDSVIEPAPAPEARVMAARYVERPAKPAIDRDEAAQRDLIYELATAKNRRSEKKSFVASTVAPVVKKPWDFLKAVGDKIK